MANDFRKINKLILGIPMSVDYISFSVYKIQAFEIQTKPSGTK